MAIPRRARMSVLALVVPAVVSVLACGRKQQSPAKTPAPAPPAAVETPSSPPAVPAPPLTASQPEDFLRLESRWADALAAKDRATLESLLAPEFLITGVGSTATDAVGGRAEWLEKVQQYPWPRHQILDLHLAQASPDVMVVKCIWRAEYPPNSITDAGGTVNLLETDVWARRNDRWLVIARHTSFPRAEEPPPTL